MQFEIWRAMGFGVPVLGRGGRREEALSLAWELCPESLPRRPRSEDRPFLFQHPSL